LVAKELFGFLPDLHSTHFQTSFGNPLKLPSIAKLNYKSNFANQPIPQISNSTIHQVFYAPKITFDIVFYKDVRATLLICFLLSDKFILVNRIFYET
jgi:hypothetical protein